MSKKIFMCDAYHNHIFVLKILSWQISHFLFKKINNQTSTTFSVIHFHSIHVFMILHVILFTKWNNVTLACNTLSLYTCFRTHIPFSLKNIRAKIIYNCKYKINWDSLKLHIFLYYTVSVTHYIFHKMQLNYDRTLTSPYFEQKSMIKVYYFFFLRLQKQPSNYVGKNRR